MNRVQPRVTWWDNFQNLGRDFEITLDNTDEEYRFCFHVSSTEFLVRNDQVIIDRIKKAAGVLMSDYEKHHGQA